MVYPWLTHYPEGVDWNQQFEAKPIYAALDDAVRQWPDNYFLDFFDNKLTYREVGRLVDSAAKGFQSLGVIPGTKVGLFLPNCPQQVIAFYGVLKAGGTVVNFSPLYSEPELLNQIEDSETDIMVTLDLKVLYPKVRTLLAESRLRRIIVGGLQDFMPTAKRLLFPLVRRSMIEPVDFDISHTAFGDLIDNDGAYDPVDIDADEDIAVLQYTGGTTGVPKGAMLSHGNIYINAAQATAWGVQFEKGKERTIGALPFFHAFAMTSVLQLSVMNGGEIILHPRFDLDELMKDTEKKRPTLMAGVPTMFTAINNHPKASRETLGSLKWCVSGGAPLPEEVKDRFRELTGVEIVEGYGLSETSPMATTGLYVGLNKPGSIGLPIPQTKIVIVDKENPHAILPLGEAGEICIEGPQVMKGYWKNEAATEAVMVDGRFRTGDVGYMDEEGYTFIIDRMKDMILVGGFNVYPRFVEEAIHKHPAVSEVTVIGVPDEYSGQVPKAFVVLKNPEESLGEEALLAFLSEHIGKHEMPREIEFRDELPKTMVGKLSKKELVEEEIAKQARESA